MASPPAPVAVSVCPARLAAAFAPVPDPRRAASVVSPLPASLALAVAALLANHRSVLASAAWGARQAAAVLPALGFPAGRTPCQSTLQRLFRHLDGKALPAVLSQCGAPGAAPAASAPASHGVAIAGKAQRGRRRFADDGCPVHALSAFGHDHGVVLAPEPIMAGPDTAEAALTVAPALLARIDWQGRVLTGDAVFCQRPLGAPVPVTGGDDLLLVKETQGTGYGEIHRRCEPPARGPAAPLADRRVARTVESGRGRRLARREVIASTDLSDSLDWPGVHQVFRLERPWRAHGVPKRALPDGITSLSPAPADAARLLTLRRDHWRSENGLHRHKDVNFGEDARLIHVGQGPTVMAPLRDAALSLLPRAGVRRVAARVRWPSQHPAHAVALGLGRFPAGA